MALQDSINNVRNALGQAGRDLSNAEWRQLLEEIGADIEGHLDALDDEAELAEGETL